MPPVPPFSACSAPVWTSASRVGTCPESRCRRSPTASPGRDMADEALDRDLDQMTGSPALVKQIKQIKQSLHRLADGAGGPRLAEVARDVLDGRMALRDLGKSAAY